MNKPTPLETLNKIIEDYEAQMESVSLQLREETNFEDEYTAELIEQLSEEWDELNEYLENLKIIRESF